MSIMKARILYVEDDLTLSFVTRDNLEMQGYTISFSDNGLSALDLFRKEGPFDLCIFDVMLPEMDGFELAKEIRRTDEHVPIIFLTAKSTKEDRIFGLKLGADDYMTKPFSIEELVLKIEVFLKRSRMTVEQTQSPVPYNFGNFVFDVQNQQLESQGKISQLTQRESDLLKALCQYRDTIVKRDDILKQVWGDDHYFASRSLDVFISRLRKHLKSDKSVKIENIHNVGFRLKTKN